jgi:hypothetical protein
MLAAATERWPEAAVAIASTGLVAGRHCRRLAAARHLGASGWPAHARPTTARSPSRPGRRRHAPPSLGQLLPEQRCASASTTERDESDNRERGD